MKTVIVGIILDLKKGISLLMMIFAVIPLYGQRINTDSLMAEATRLEEEGLYLLNKGDAESAFPKLLESARIVKDLQGKESLNYAKNLFFLSICHSRKAEFEKAINVATEAMEIIKNSQGTSEFYGLVLSYLASYYSGCSNYEKAIELENIAKTLFKESSPIENENYAMSLNNLAVYYSEIGKYMEAVTLVKKAIEIRGKLLGEKHPDYAMSLNNLANYYSFLGFNGKAVEVGKRAVEIRKAVLGINHPDYATSLNNLAVFNREIGNYSEALKLGTEAVEIRKIILGEHPLYAMSLANLASTNYCLGNYDKAIEHEHMAIEILKKHLGINNPRYAMALSNQALFKSRANDLTEAVKLEMESLRIRKSVLGSKHPDYASSLNNISTYYGELKKYSEAIHYLKKASKIRKKSLGIDHPDYIQSLSNLALYYFCTNKIDDAIRIGEDVAIATKNTLGPEHPEYARVLENLSSYHMKRNNYHKAIDEMNTSIDIRSKQIVTIFAGISSQRRYYYWNKEKEFFLFNYPKFAYKMPNPDLISNLYDKTALLAKGILLNTDVEMKKLIEEYGDPIIIDKYKDIQSNYEIYNAQATLPIANRIINTDSLKQAIERQEDELVRNVKIYGDYMRNLKLTWKDIRQSLKEDDIALEFLDFPVGEDSIMYVALTLKKSYSNPRMIPLFELRQLNRIQKNNYYSSPELAKLIWGPLEDELVGIKNVYFSPSGELHRLGIEYLATSEKEHIFDKYQMYRLSSTRQLVLDRKPLSRKKAVLYGGIDYNASLDTIMSVERLSKGIQNPFVGSIQVDSLSVRDSREYLEGTKIEADNISTSLKMHCWGCDYYTGANGTEESFKMMSGKSPSLLHVATHGFYMTETDVNKERKIAFHESKRSTDEHYVIREDKPMTRSGLLLAGCNHTLNHETIPEDSEDGILIAQEIASLDLRGLDLVVLSACETGLGDISSGEGVFGLQRGFKKAGANTIIMSLWKVSDKATESLMTYFYQFFLNGMTKYNAFSAAREKLRKECPPRQKKPDWAAFIMLDGIN